MGFLTDYWDNELEFSGHRYKLDLSYDTVLNIQRMFRERKLNDAEMLLRALELFGVPDREVGKMTWPQRSDLIQKIFEEKVKTKPRPRVGKQQKLFDFEDDGEYIYASFLQDYGIDLIDCQGKLSWQRFIALFQGLSDETKIKRIMSIRGREIPAPTQTNQKEIQNLTEMKMYYALDYKEDNAKDGLARLFSTLEGMV